MSPLLSLVPCVKMFEVEVLEAIFNLLFLPNIKGTMLGLFNHEKSDSMSG